MNIDGLINYGAMGIVLAYFIWKDNNTMKEFRNSLEALKDAITIIKAELCEKKENK